MVGVFESRDGVQWWLLFRQDGNNMQLVGEGGREE